MTRLEASQSLLLWASNTSSLQVYHTSLTNLISGTNANWSLIPVDTISTTVTAIFYTFLAQGQSTAGDRTLWISGDNQVNRYKILTNGSAIPLTGLNGTHIEMYNYNEQAVLFNQDYIYSLQSYEQVDNSTLANFGTNITFHEKTSLNSDTSLLSVYEIIAGSPFGTNAQAVRQFQIVSDCALY